MPCRRQIQPALSIEHIAVHFGGLVAISDLNFTVREGEIVGLIGPNGAGKTTAFNVITGFPAARRTARSAIAGRRLNGLKPHEIAAARPGADVPAHQRVPEQQRVRERADRPAPARPLDALWDTLLALPRERDAERELADEAGEILRLVGLERRARELARIASLWRAAPARRGAGARRRPLDAAAGRAGVGHERRRKQRGSCICSIGMRASGVTILLVEHDMPMVMGVSDRIVVLNYGRIIAEGPPAAIQGNPDVIRAYLGRERRNVLELRDVVCCYGQVAGAQGHFAVGQAGRSWSR